MSTFKRARVTGGAARDSVFASLRETQIINSKPVLPAEILSTIVDHLPIPCLLRFARVSKRMREMVYDDTRWVQRLRLMGCWDEQEARRRAETARRKRAETLQALQQKEQKEEAKKAGIGVRDGDQTVTPSIAIFDATEEIQNQAHPNGLVQNLESVTLGDGFDAVDLAPDNIREAPSPLKFQDVASRLNIFSQVRSLRGVARLEYGKVYGALAPLYLDAINVQNHTQATVFRTYRDPEHQARMLSNLIRFCGSDMSQGWQQRIHQLEALVQAFERAVTREFEQALDAEDVAGKMRKYAHVLVSLDGGRNGVELFISRAPIISSRYRLGNPLDCLNDSTSGNFSADQSFAFFKNLSMAFNEQVAIIDQVFPPSINAILLLLERVGRLVIAEYLTALFDEAHRTNIEAYLKAVSATSSQSLTWAKSLRPTSDIGDEFYEAVDKITAEVFEPHVDLYLAEELSFFKKNSDAEVSNWERQLSEQDESMQSMFMSNVNRQADKRDFLASFRKVVMMPVNVLPTMSSPFGGKSATAKALVNGETLATQATTSQSSTRPSSPGIGSGTNLGAYRSSTPLPEPPTTELAAKAAIMNSRLEGIRSLFSIEIALNLVHGAKTSIERAVVLVNMSAQFAKDAKLQCELIFIALLQTLGTRHIKSGFDQAVEHLSNYNPRKVSEHRPLGATPLVTFLELVNVGDLIQQMLDVFYEQELIAAKLTTRDDFLNPATKEKKRFEQMLDARVAAGLNTGIEVLMGEIEHVCATTQRPEDFNPPAQPNGGGGSRDLLDIGPSQTAVQIVEIVSNHSKMLAGSTDKNMLDVFNTEVGMRLFTALCKHLKRQRISVAGSIKLISDTTHYYTYIAMLRLKPLIPFFVALRELSQIFLVDASDAKALAQIIADGDRFQGIFRAEEVYEFAQRRTDWPLIRGKVERAMYGIGCVVM